MLKKYLLRLKTYHLRAWREQKGQSLIIFVFAILGIIAMMGLALDLGLVYIERVRVSRTTDAAALAAVVELPFEEEAIRRAAEFIELNGYTQQDTEIRVRGCITIPPPDGNGIDLGNVGDEPLPYPPTAFVDSQPDNVVSGYLYQPSLETPPRQVFVIDTLAYQPVDRNDSTGEVETENQETCDGASNDSSSLFGTANKLRVAGRVDVDMNFMQFFGFGVVPVSDQSVGENVTNLDVAVVFDVSGSMDFETNCFGCWNEVSALSDDIMNNPFPSNGLFNPLDYNIPDDDDDGNNIDIFWGGDSSPPSDFGDPTKAGHPVCSAAPTPIVTGPPNNYRYSVHEAEFYSLDSPINGWEFEQRVPGQGFWVIQRINRGSNNSFIRPHSFVTYSQGQMVNFPQLQGASYNIECFNATSQCWKSRGDAIGEVAPNNPPFVEYDFTVDWDSASQSNTHIWIRAIGGSNHAFEWYGQSAQQLNDWRETIYWQINNGTVFGGPFTNLNNQNTNRTSVNNNDWRWVKIANGVDLANGQHTLRLYQGSAGFNLDKIIFTNNPDGTVNTAVNNNGSIVGGGSLGITSLLDDNGGEGPVATNGSATRNACNMCNAAFGQTVTNAQCTCKTGPSDTTVGPIYPGGGTGSGCFATGVLTPTNHLQNDLYHDIDPLRSAQEAVKNFAARLDPKFDQIGIAAFSDSMKSPRVKLQCLRYEQQNNAVEGQRNCFDPTSTPISYTRTIQALEDHVNGGSTDIAEGMREGLEELGISIAGYNTNVEHDCSTSTSVNGDKQACDRQGAARRVLILMTDGSPNNHVTCPGSFTWRGQAGGGGGNDDFDCAMFYASQAADNNVIVYTIGIGAGVNRELLTAMAEGTDPNPAPGDDGFYFTSKGGKYFPAAKPSDLDSIFEQILENIFVRIVG